MRIKVCHMTNAHPSNDGRIFHKECASLADAGYEVFLVAPGESRKGKGVHVIGVGTKPQNRLWRMTSFARRVYLKAAELDCDIYHFHDPELLPYGRKLKRRGKKVIFDSHENYTAQIEGKSYIPKPFRKAVAMLYRAFETRIVKKIDAVLAPCTFNGENIFNERAKRTVILANYPQNISLNKDAIEVDDRTYICYAGALSYNRGITHLIKAAALANVKLVLAGAFSSPQYQKEVESMPEYAIVDYRGTVGREQLEGIYRFAFAGMSTLLPCGQYCALDTLATKVFEYMMSGIPVILTDYPYARKALEAHHFGICVDSTKIQDIADAIGYLREHPIVAQQMGENGRRAVVREFNWGEEEKKLLKLYADLFDEKEYCT